MWAAVCGHNAGVEETSKWARVGVDNLSLNPVVSEPGLIEINDFSQLAPAILSTDILLSKLLTSLKFGQAGLYSSVLTAAAHQPYMDRIKHHGVFRTLRG